MVLWHSRWQKNLRSVIALSIALWLVVSVAHGSHQPIWAQAADPSLDQLREQRDQLDEQRKLYDETDERYQRAEDQATQNLRDLSKTLQSTDSWITNTEYQLAQAERRLSQLEADLEKNKKDYETARTAVVGRLQFMQRQQSAQGWALLLQSQNLNDFLDRRYRLKRVYESDRETLVELDAYSEEIVAQQASVEQQKNSIGLLRQQLLLSRDQYTAQVQQQAGLMARLQENRGALTAAIDQLDAESADITALILEKVAAADAADASAIREEVLRAARSSGKMLRPSYGPITSNFGRRYHPVLGYSRFHAGTDFGAEHGSPIQAAETGIVIFSGWYGGYGNTVILEHGGGVTTLYAHASRLNVSEGQAVRKGDAIAAIGSTGLSTGPHLHFEVRRSGEPVDPLGFI
ncbi:MAG: peptidoglycan DD-metalloendopeptidase family protein [Cyanobacteria bacterium J06627_28]